MGAKIGIGSLHSGDKMTSLQILVLSDKKSSSANTVLEHIESFEHYSQHHIWAYSCMGENFSLDLDLNKFDVIIVHYSLSLLYDHHITLATKERLRLFKGLKVLFIQDEYRQINQVISQMQFINFDILFTCFPEPEIEKIYPKTLLPNVAKFNNLTGYIPEPVSLPIQIPLSKDRRIDVGYRGRKIPFWLGELAYEKYSIVDAWQEHTKTFGLKTNISYNEHERIYGKKWVNFLMSCKTTLGVESGASVMDFDGSLERDIRQWLKINPKSSFFEVRDRFLKEHEGKYKLNQISPRCFEAIAYKTVLVLYEGEYSGILVADRHYIMLKKDFSNINQVVASIKDSAFLQHIADTAYEEIYLNPKYSYKTFITQVDSIIETEFVKRNKIPVIDCYSKNDFNKAIFSIRNPIKNAYNYFKVELAKILVNKIKVFNPLLRLMNKLED